MRLKKAPLESQPSAEAPKPPPWSVRYRAVFDDGAVSEWEDTFDFQPDDRERAAGNILLAQKYGIYSQIVDGKLYPPHRLREVTWTVL